tara:strand:- start:508 stop:696 length:189 start_codon:yes stop_codon:yes gene_type:complete
MSNGMPKLGYSNLYWSKVKRKKSKKAIILQEEILEEAVVIDSLEVSLVDKLQLQTLSDKKCP